MPPKTAEIGSENLFSNQSTITGVFAMRNLCLDHEYRLRPRLDSQPEPGQLDALNKVGCETIFQEKVPGATKVRPELDRMLAGLRPGDAVYIYKFDRLGRSPKHLLDMVVELEFRGVALVSPSTPPRPRAGSCLTCSPPWPNLSGNCFGSVPMRGWSQLGREVG